MIETVKKVNGASVPYVIEERRPGDIAACYADCSLAGEKLGWKAEKGIEDMCRDAYNFASKK